MALLLGLAASPAQALTFDIAEADLSLYYPAEEVVSISTGTYKAIHLAPSVASVIRADEIHASGARSLDEVLESIPGLHVSRSAFRNSALYSMRGIHSDWNPQVLLLVNGLPFNDLITGARPPLFRLPMENIALIEVVRGPGSALFGADAFAGVINVITKEGLDTEGAMIGGRGGSFDSRDAWLQYGAGHGGWEVGLSLEYSGSAGDRNRIISNDYQSELDNQYGTAATLAPGPLQSGYEMLNGSLNLRRGEWSLWFNHWRLDDAGLGPGVAQALDPAGRQENDQYALVLDYKGDDRGGAWQWLSRLAYRNFDQQSYFQILPPGARVPVGSDGNLCFPPGCSAAGLVEFTDGLLGNPGGRLTDVRFEVATLYRGWRRQRLRLAAGMDRDSLSPMETKNFGPGVIDGTISPIGGALTDVSGTPYIYVKQHAREVHYVSLQDEWRLAQNWELTAGIRHDHYSDFGDTTNPRLALVWATAYNFTSKLLYGRAFRAPSITELYFENNPVTLGNPELKPEQIDMVELVFDYRPSARRQTVLSLFSYQANDLIEFIDGLAQNARNQEGHGLELEANWYASERLRLKSNFALQYSENASSGAVIANAPRWQLYLAADWRMAPAWALFGQANWVADRARNTGDSRPAIADYTTFDLALRYQARQRPWELGAGIKNMFDSDAREPSDGKIADDYPLEGRSFYLQAQYQLETL